MGSDIWDVVGDTIIFFLHFSLSIWSCILAVLFKVGTDNSLRVLAFLETFGFFSGVKSRLYTDFLSGSGLGKGFGVV